MAYPKPLERLIGAFERFPGIGRRTAERLAFHVLRDPEAMELADALKDAAANTRRCAECHNVAERDPCAICADLERDRTQVLVVEEPRDVMAVSDTIVNVQTGTGNRIEYWDRSGTPFDSKGALRRYIDQNRLTKGR